MGRSPLRCATHTVPHGQERSECRHRLLSALGSGWEMAEFALDPEDFGPVARKLGKFSPEKVYETVVI